MFERRKPRPGKEERPSSAKVDPKPGKVKPRPVSASKRTPVLLANIGRQRVYAPAKDARPRVKQGPWDKERLYEEQLALKVNNNSLRDENMKLKTRVNALEKEVMRYGELVEGQSGEKFPQQTGHLVSSLKQAVKDLKNELKVRDEEIGELKKNIKTTRTSELEVELQAYIDECTRLRHHLEEVLSRQTELLNLETPYIQDPQQGAAINSLQLDNQAIMQQLEQAQKELERWKDRAKDLEKKAAKAKKSPERQLKTEFVKVKSELEKSEKQKNELLTSFEEEKSRFSKETTSKDEQLRKIQSRLSDSEASNLTLQKQCQEQQLELKSLRNQLTELQREVLLLSKHTQGHDMKPSSKPARVFHKIHKYIQQKNILLSVFFSLLDRNNKGTLDAKELLNGLKKYGIVTRQEQAEEAVIVASGGKTVVTLAQLESQYERYDFSAQYESSSEEEEPKPKSETKPVEQRPGKTESRPSGGSTESKPATSKMEVAKEEEKVQVKRPPSPVRPPSPQEPPKAGHNHRTRGPDRERKDEEPPVVMSAPQQLPTLNVPQSMDVMKKPTEEKKIEEPKKMVGVEEVKTGVKPGNIEPVIPQKPAVIEEVKTVPKPTIVEHPKPQPVVTEEVKAIPRPVDPPKQQERKPEEPPKPVQDVRKTEPVPPAKQEAKQEAKETPSEQPLPVVTSKPEPKPLEPPVQPNPPVTKPIEKKPEIEEVKTATKSEHRKTQEEPTMKAEVKEVPKVPEVSPPPRKDQQLRSSDPQPPQPTPDTAWRPVAVGEVADILRHITFRLQIHRIAKDKIPMLLFGETWKQQRDVTVFELQEMLAQQPININEPVQAELLSRFLIESDDSGKRKGSTEASSATAILAKLNTALPDWHIFSTEDEEQYDDEIADILADRAIDLQAACEEADTAHEGYISLKTFRGLLKKLGFHFKSNHLKYLELLFYSHEFELDRVPYYNFLKAYTGEKDEEEYSQEQFDEEGYVDDEERAEMVKAYLFEMAHAMVQRKKTVEKVFDISEDGRIYPPEFVFGTRALGLPDLRKEDLILVLESLQDEESEALCVNPQYLGEVLEHLAGAYDEVQEESSE